MTDADRAMWAEYVEKQTKYLSVPSPALAISEKEWQEQVEQLAVMNGWKKYHTWNSKHSDQDFPDLIMVKGTRLVVAELKKEGEEPSLGQWQWLTAFWQTGAEAYFWQPSDIDHVVKVLQSKESMRCLSDPREPIKGDKNGKWKTSDEAD